MIKILQVLNKDIPTHDYRAQLYKIPSVSVDFIVPYTEKEYKNINKYHIELTGGFHIKKDLISTFKLFKFLISNKYDIIHWYSSKYYLIGPIIGLLTFNFSNVITINGLGRVFTSKKYRLLKPIFMFFLIISSFISRKIILQNNEDLKFIKKFLPSFLHKKTTLVYSGVEKQDNCIIDDSKFNVINISRIMNEKGIKEFLDIAESLKEINSKITFILIGESSGDHTLDERVQKAAKKNIIKYINYTNEPFKYIVDSKLLLFTSHREGLPRVIIECMSCNVPVIAYDVVGVKETIEDGLNGYLFDKLEKEKIIEKIIQLYNNRDLLNKISNGAEIVFNKKFTINAYLNSMEFLYKEIKC